MEWDDRMFDDGSYSMKGTRLLIFTCVCLLSEIQQKTTYLVWYDRHVIFFHTFLFSHNSKKKKQALNCFWGQLKWWWRESQGDFIVDSDTKMSNDMKAEWKIQRKQAHNEKKKKKTTAEINRLQSSRNRNFR